MPHSICSKDNLPENYQTCIIKWKTETARHTIPTRPILIKKYGHTWENIPYMDIQ